MASFIAAFFSSIRNSPCKKRSYNELIEVLLIGHREI
ncbi:MAG: hypothetical protein ACI92X_001419 [Dokdonia sp.]|jgi:hypothetical protein